MADIMTSQERKEVSRRLRVAEKSARAAGAILAGYFNRAIKVEVKDDRTYVTAADREAERVVRGHIAEKFSKDAIVGEEEGEEKNGAPFRWVIDPLDGTANFINGLPIFAASIAIEYNHEVVAAAIFNPLTKSLVSAQKDGGAFWNGTRVYVSKNGAADAMISFGMSPKPRDRVLMKRLFVESQKTIRRARHLGSAAMELAYIARGGTEGYINIGTKLWDYAAGWLLVKEAGGKITDFDGKDCPITERRFIASNGVVHDDLVKTVKGVIKKGKTVI